jgi:hypothetical protein
VGVQHHAPATLPPGKTRYPLGGPQGWSGHVQSCPHWDSVSPYAWCNNINHNNLSTKFSFIEQCKPIHIPQHRWVSDHELLKKLHTSQVWLPIQLPYFPAHKMHRDFFVRNFIKKKSSDERILILVIYLKKTRLLHTKISNHNIIYSSDIILSYLTFWHRNLAFKFYHILYIKCE